MVGLGQLLGHLVVVPALVRQLGSAPLIGPGSKQNGDRSVCLDLPAKLLHTGKEALGGSDGAVTHLLEHHIAPLLVLKRRLGLTAQPGVGVQLFRQPCPAPGVVDHLRPGQVSKHLRHIVGKRKAVAQHKDPHGTAPYSFIYCFQLPLYTAPPRGTRPGNAMGLSDFATQETKIRLR